MNILSTEGKVQPAALCSLRPGSLRSGQSFLIFRRGRPLSVPVPLPARLSPGPLVALTAPGVEGELDVPVVEAHGPQQEEEDEGEAETEAALVLIDEAITVVAVVGVPTPVENNHPQRTCEEQYDEQPGVKIR